MQGEKTTCLPCLITKVLLQTLALDLLQLVARLNWHDVYEHTRIHTINKTRDGNGDPIPVSPRGIPLLGYGDGTKSIPTGI
jgi:hypothetical protein